MTLSTHASSRPASAASLALAAALAMPASAAVECTLIEGGSFDGDLSGWTFDFTEVPSGDAGTFTSAGIVDGTPWNLDGNVLGLQISAYAGWNGSTGAAISEIVAERALIAEGTTMRVTFGGGFEFLFFGAAGRGLEAVIEVEAADGAIAPLVLQDSLVGAGPECEPGLSVLGVFGLPTIADIDLAGAGIEVGDTVTLRVRLAADARAAVACQSVDVSALLVVDAISFCADPADLDGDGSVAFGDLLLLLAAWGDCPPGGPCPADLNGDLSVGFGDLLIVLESWTG